MVTELFAGTRSREESASLERFFEYFVRHCLVLVPDYDDWKLTGRLISRRSRLVGAIRPRDHQNDVLIAILAARVGGTIYTANPRHLGIWAEMLRDGGLGVSVTEIT